MSDESLARAAAAADRLEDRFTWEQANRLGLLRVHAIVGILGGIQILLYGGPSNLEESLGVWTRPALGVLAVVGGTILALGLARRPRDIGLEAVGLSLVGLWDLAMTLGLAWTRIEQGEYAPIPLTQALDPTYVRPYPVTVYAGLFALICIHLWTLRRMHLGSRNV